MKDLLQKLTDTPGPSGHENLVREVVRQEIAPLSDEVQVDALGNLIARKGQKSDEGSKIMLVAHIDEIGVMVTHVDENGFLRFLPIGGVRAHTFTGGRVRFLNGQTGVLYYERSQDASKLPSFDKMYIDIGAINREEVTLKVGDVAAFDRPFSDLGKRLVSKAMDDRVGVAVLIQTLKGLEDSPHEVFFVFSVQEEVGVRGATTAAFGVDPDLGLAVDVTGTGDTPKDVKMEVTLGRGPAIKVRDGGMLSDRRIVDWMARTAEGIKLPYQLEVLEAGSTDARAMQLTRAGVPAGCLSIPCRYIHSPSEMVDYDDVQNAVKLLQELLRHPVEL